MHVVRMPMEGVLKFALLINDYLYERKPLKLPIDGLTKEEQQALLRCVYGRPKGRNSHGQYVVYHCHGNFTYHNIWGSDRLGQFAMHWI